MSIFKACDVRGRYADELDERACAGIGLALSQLAGDKATVLVGGDVRHSTPALKQSLIAGLQQGGARVLDLGIVPTPVAYFAHGHLGSNALAVVTASHNPPEYNGVKFMLGSHPVDESAMTQLARLVDAGRGLALETTPQSPVETHDPLPDYTEWLYSCFDDGAGRPVVLDPGHGSYSGLAGAVCRRLGYDVEVLFDTPDGAFPGRSGDCSIKANLGALRERVVARSGAVGLAFDGDGDRVALIDEQGRMMRAESVAVLLLRHLTPAHSDEKVVYDQKSSMFLPRLIEAHGCRALIERSGHAFMKARMLEEDALLGCEISGHYFHRALHGGDDGLYTGLMLLEALAGAGVTAATLADAMPVPAITPELRIPLADLDPDEIMEALRGGMPPEQCRTLDGLRLEWPDGWALLRRSGTEPVMTMRLEGEDDAALRKIKRRVVALAKGLGPYLE